MENASGNYAYSDHACVALVGVENLVVVSMGDAVLVASKEHAESIKSLVDHLKSNGQDIALQHNRVYRPWGWYQGLNRGDRYQVKCIMVKPGGTLSLQSHHHRSEHWVVVKGTLEVTKGDGNEPPYREPVDLYRHRREASPRQPRQDPSLPHRGAIRRLSR